MTRVYSRTFASSEPCFLKLECVGGAELTIADTDNEGHPVSPAEKARYLPHIAEALAWFNETKPELAGMFDGALVTIDLRDRPSTHGYRGVLHYIAKDIARGS